MKKVLIDTDVILDFFFDRKPFSDDATQILDLCEKKEIKGYITSIILSNLYYLLRKTAKHEKVISKLKMLLNILDILITNKKVVLEALNSDFKDFEDALQNFSAQNSDEVSILITRNTKDYKKSELAVFSPEMFLKVRNIA